MLLVKYDQSHERVVQEQDLPWWVGIFIFYLFVCLYVFVVVKFDQAHKTRFFSSQEHFGECGFFVCWGSGVLLRVYVCMYVCMIVDYDRCLAFGRVCNLCVCIHGYMHMHSHTHIHTHTHVYMHTQRDVQGKRVRSPTENHTQFV